MKSKQERTQSSLVKRVPPSIDNRRARHEYEVLESLEAGLVLTGTGLVDSRGRRQLERSVRALSRR